MATGRRWTGQTGRKVATIVAGMALAGSAWTGVAVAAPAADASECQDQANEITSLLQEFGQGQGALEKALATITPAQYQEQVSDLLGQQNEINQATREFNQNCSGRAAQATGTTSSTTPTSTTTTSAAPTSTTTASGTADRDCPDFTSQAAAQAYFTSIGGSAARNADRLDRNRNGIACEDYNYGTTAATAATAATTAGTSQMSVVPSGGVNTGDGSFGG